MKIVCPACNASYTIPDRKIPVGKKATATCKRCGKRIEVSAVSETQTVQPVPTTKQVIPAAAPTEPGPVHTGIDEAIFTEYPDLRDLSTDKFDLNEIFTENKKGGYKTRNNSFKVKIIKSVSEVLPRMLHDHERVVRVAKGTASYPIEVFLGNGFLTMMYNHYAVICTTQRILFINIDHRMKKSTHYLFQMTYPELKKIGRGSIFGSLTFQPKIGKKRAFSGMKRAFSKEIKDYVTAKMLTPSPANPDHDFEDLCPSCLTGLGKGLVECSSCKAPFKEPKKALTRSLILPGWGDIYLGHRALGTLELIGSVVVWFIILASIFAVEEGGLGVAIFILIIYNGLDGLLTFHMAKKGYMLA